MSVITVSMSFKTDYEESVNKITFEEQIPPSVDSLFSEFMAESHTPKEIDLLALVARKRPGLITERIIEEIAEILKIHRESGFTRFEESVEPCIMLLYNVASARGGESIDPAGYYLVDYLFQDTGPESEILRKAFINWLISKVDGPEELQQMVS